jgi:hypothetical protein
MIIILGLILFLLGSPVVALQQAAYNLNLPNYKTAQKTELHIIHRFLGVVNKDEFLGMDVGANVSLGLSFKIRDNLDISLLRSRLNKEYLIGGKLNFSDNPEAGVSILAGGVFKADALVTKNKTTIFTQLVISRTFWNNQLLVSLIPSFASATDNNDQSPTENDTLALGTSVTFTRRIESGFIEEAGMAGEHILVMAGHRLPYPTSTLGIKLKTFGHYFSLLVTNSLYFTPGAYLIGSNSTDYYLGFNITRKF